MAFQRLSGAFWGPGRPQEGTLGDFGRERVNQKMVWTALGAVLGPSWLLLGPFWVASQIIKSYSVFSILCAWFLVMFCPLLPCSLRARRRCEHAQILKFHCFLWVGSYVRLFRGNEQTNKTIEHPSQNTSRKCIRKRTQARYEKAAQIIHKSTKQLPNGTPQAPQSGPRSVWKLETLPAYLLVIWGAFSYSVCVRFPMLFRDVFCEGCSVFKLPRKRRT